MYWGHQLSLRWLMVLQMARQLQMTHVDFSVVQSASPLPLVTRGVHCGVPWFRGITPHLHQNVARKSKGKMCIYTIGSMAKSTHETRHAFVVFLSLRPRARASVTVQWQYPRQLWRRRPRQVHCSYTVIEAGMKDEKSRRKWPRHANFPEGVLDAEVLEFANMLSEQHEHNPEPP